MVSYAAMVELMAYTGIDHRRIRVCGLGAYAPKERG